MASTSSAVSSPATARRQMAGNLRYIRDAPLANCKVTVDKEQREALARMGAWHGQDGNCIFTNPQLAAAGGAAVDRGGYTDPGQRCKIVKQVFANGTEVPESVYRAAARAGGVYPPSQNVVVWDGYDNNKRLTAQQVVLRVTKPDLFDRLYRWSQGEFDQSVTFMIGHRCGNGNLGCITGDHLFLVTGSANQSQRNCILPKLVPCGGCGYFPQYTECYCSKNIPNPAMPDGKCPICVCCPPTAGTAGVSQDEYNRVVRENNQLRTQLNSTHAAYITHSQISQVLRTRLEDAERQYRELEERLESMQMRD